MKIAVAGVGYVGLSIAVLLAQHNEVTALTTTAKKVEMINKRQSPIQDAEIEEYLSTKDLNLTATIDRETTYKDADYVVVATPTDYDPVKWEDCCMLEGLKISKILFAGLVEQQQCCFFYFRRRICLPL